MKLAEYRRSRLGSIAVMCVVVGATWLLSFGQAFGQDTSSVDVWSDWKFLIGEWVTDSGVTNNGSGSFSLLPDLQKQILVRTNHAEYPASNGRPASTHDDLMVIYHDAGKNARAMYFDTEGHVVSYEVTSSAAKDSLIFVSIPDAQGFRFRLTYSKATGEKVKVSFEVAPPGILAKFSKFLEGVVRRK